MAAFAVSLFLRVGAGEPLLGLPAFIAYPELWPVRTVAAATGLILLPLVSRLTPSDPDTADHPGGATLAKLAETPLRR